jgi:cellobiose PTS system EIIC component
LALASIVPAVFNVNEPVLFGFPVVFNPRLFFPFVLAPLANLGLARVAVDLGWVHIERTDVPFNLPVLVSAWLVSGGELAAVALQVAAVAVSTVVYYPFVGRFGAALVGSESVLRQVDEEIDHRIGDPLGPLLKGSWGRDDARRRIAAVARSDLVLSYQPKVARDSGEVVGVEALLRIASDDGGRATPGGWLKDVARSGLSVDTDLWVLDRVHRQLVAWRDHQDAPAIAMNLAVDSLRSQRVLDALVAVAEAFPGRLSVEITEEGLLAHDDVSGAAIERLAQAGIRTFIDDFGTGFSGLSYLRRYRVDGIKIDREFTAGLGAPRGRELFEEMCTLAQRLDLDVVVEGVEEDWQLVHVPAGRGIAVQGWLYAPALEPDEVLDFVRARRPRPRPSWVHDRA